MKEVVKYGNIKKAVLAVVSVLPLVITLIAINFMNDKVPMHYGISGEIDRWGSKYENLGFPIMIIVMSVIWHLVIMYFKRKAEKCADDSDNKKYKDAVSSANMLYYVAVLMAIQFGIMQILILLSAYSAAGNSSGSLNIKIDSFSISNAVLGVFVALMGILVQSKKNKNPNGMVGIRTVWSTENEIVWQKSNMYGGRIIMAAGILSAIIALFTSGFVGVVILLILIIASGIAAVYISYVMYKKYK